MHTTWSSYAGNFDFTNGQVNFKISMSKIHRSRLVDYEDYVRNNAKIRYRSTIHQLLTDLVEEIWGHFRVNENDDYFLFFSNFFSFRM